VNRSSLFFGAASLLGAVVLLLLPLCPASAGAGPGPSARPQGLLQTQAPRSAEPAVNLQGKVVKPYTLPAEKYQKAVAFHRAFYRLYFLGFVYGLLTLLLVLRWRLGPRYRDLAERLSSRRVLQAMVCAPLLLLTLRALNLPRGAYSHWLLLEYGQSVQGWGGWVWDWLKVQLLLAALGAFVVWVLYGVMRRSPRRWWFYSWLALLPMIAFVLFVEPVVIEPMFFHFEPLAARHPQLVAQIEKVVERGGLRIPPDRMWEMKASEKVTAVNAYVTGLGASKRVVVWDTTLERLNPPQVLTVFGHELGHYVLGHVAQGMAYLAAGLFVFLWASSWLLPAALRRWGQRWKIRGLDDWASLPLLLLLYSLFSFFAAPIENAISRRIEHQADVYSLEVTHGLLPDAGEVAAQTFQISGETNLDDPSPSPFIKIWLYSHPPTAERIIFAQTYDPWASGQPPKYVPAQ